MSLLVFKFTVACGCLSVAAGILMLFSVSTIDDYDMAQIKTNRNMYRAHPVAFIVTGLFLLLVFLTAVSAFAAAVMWLFGV